MAAHSRYRAGSMRRSDTVRRLFGAAHFSKSIIWSSTDILLLFLVHSNMKSDAAAAGTIVFFMMGYSCLLDLPIAFLLTRFSDPRLQSIKLQAFAGPATGLALVGIFVGMLMSSSLTVALMTFIFRTAYAFLDVTHNALTTLLPDNAEDTDRYVVTRSILSSVARLCIAAAGYWLITQQSDGSMLGLWVSAVLAMMLTVTTAPLVWVARRRVVAEPERSEFAISPRMALIAGAALLQAGPLSIAGRLLPFAKGGDATIATGLSLVAFIIGSILAPMLGSRLSRYVSHATLWFASVFTTALCGVLSMTGTRIWLSVSEAMAFGVTNGVLGYLIWSAASTEVRKSAMKVGRRRDLTCFATLSTASKAAVGFSALMISPWLPAFVSGDALAASYLVAIQLAGAVALLVLTGVLFAPWRRHHGFATNPS